MTYVRIIKNNDKITKVEATGHAGYAKEGEDIVCASLSSIIQTAALGLMSVLGLSIDLQKDEKTGSLSFKLPETMSEKKSEKSQAILETMLMGISDLAGEYSEFIKLEVTDNVY